MASNSESTTFTSYPDGDVVLFCFGHANWRSALPTKGLLLSNPGKGTEKYGFLWHTVRGNTPTRGFYGLFLLFLPNLSDIVIPLSGYLPYYHEMGGEKIAF